MKDFITSALPWVMAGIALAILAVNHSAEQQEDENRGSGMATGAGLGLLLGVALNSCGLWENHALGLVLGLLWGMALGACYKCEGAPKQEKDRDEEEH